MRTWKKNEAGMTLAELIAAMLIALIVMVAATSAYMFTRNLFRKNTELADRDRLTWIVSEFVKDQVSFASQLEVSFTEDTTIDPDHVIQFGSDGRLYKDGEIVYEEEIYQGIHIYCEITEPDFIEKPILEYRITALRGKDSAPCFMKSVIELFNLEKNDTMIIYPEQWEEQKEVYLFYCLEEND